MTSMINVVVAIVGGSMVGSILSSLPYIEEFPYPSSI